jgi:Domain of unknown function (DUF4382)
MNSRAIRLTLGFILAAVPIFLVGCSSGSSGSSFGSGSGSGTQNGSVNLMVSDASTDDWAAIGVKILSISLVPQGGGSNVNVFTVAQGPAPTINLVQLDQLGEILGNISVPVGTYTGAVVTISGNPGDIQLTSSADPSASLLALTSATTTVPASQIQVQGTSGSAGSLTVSVTVNFDSPLIVTANGTNALDLEFDLSHPAFLVGHLGGGSVIWAVNFNGPLHHHPIPDLSKFLLRDILGTVTSVNSDGSITITRDFPVEPAAATAIAEAPISTTHSITIFPDSTNGTLFYDVDNTSQNQTIKSYATVSADLPVGEFVRVTARFQVGSNLTAVRTWASSSFGKIYISPEGHVLHVNTNTNVIDVENEIGQPVHLTVNANTLFFSGTTQIGQGTSFLTNLERGFKIHASVVDPLASPLVSQTIDIETARYGGVISIQAASTTAFTYTRKFNTAKDNYVVTLPYISPTTANGKDPLTGNPITGFKWWNFIFPTIVDSDAKGGTDAAAINDFINATNGTTVSFGGTAPPVTASGSSYAVWGDPSALTGWSAPWTVLEPTQIQLGTAKTGYVTGSPGSFTMVVPLGPTPVIINMSTITGSGALVYNVARTGPVVTIIPEDITTSAGQNAVASTLLATTPVDVYGIPQSDGTIKAYVVLYYTGAVLPTAVD